MGGRGRGGRERTRNVSSKSLGDEKLFDKNIFHIFEPFMLSFQDIYLYNII